MTKEDVKLTLAKDLFCQGITLFESGSYEEAAKFFHQSLKMAPNRPSILINLSAAHLKLKQIKEAKDAADLAIKISPYDPLALNQLGLVYFSMEDYENASLYFQSSLEQNLSQAEVFVNLGNTYRKQSLFERALEQFDKAIVLQPDQAETYSERASILVQLNRLEDALLDYNKAIALNPSYYQAYDARGVVLMDLGRLDESLLNHNYSIAIKPDHAEAYINKANVLRKLGLRDEALENENKAIAINPLNAEAYNNRGITLKELNFLEQALESLNRAISIKPHFSEFYNNIGLCLLELNRLDEALDNFNKAILIDPEYPSAYWNRSHIKILRGDFSNGFNDYEWRKKTKKYNSGSFQNDVLWNDKDNLEGKVIFIHPELYIGDAIQFIRYARIAESKGAKVIFSTRDSLHALLKTASPSIEFISKNSKPDYYDYCCALMSLPYAFNTTIETIPSDIPYLMADKNRITKWKKRIGEEGFKIGICWQGSTLPYSIPMRRSLSLLNFANICKLPNVRLISLQKDDGLDQLNDLPSEIHVETLGDEFDAGPDAFLDTAAVMENLDLIISVDTAIAHLAGALGRPVWVALKDVPDWRWLLERSDSPWYPTMKLFRQNIRDDWRGVFDEIEIALKGMLSKNG